MIDYNNSICIEDMCGGGRFPTSYWADYYPDLLTTYFGGDWYFVPPLHTDIEPSEDIFRRWVDYHELMF